MKFWEKKTQIDWVPSEFSYSPVSLPFITGLTEAEESRSEDLDFKEKIKKE